MSAKAITYKKASNPFQWMVSFSDLLSITDMGHIGGWIAENIPNGAILSLPDAYIVHSEEDALLLYLRFK